MCRQLPSLLFKRAEAGKIQQKFAGVGTEEIPQESSDRRRIVAHDFMQPLAIFRALARYSVQRTRLRPIGNILVKARLRLFLRYQKVLVRARQIEGDAREKQDPPRFEKSAV